LPFVGAGLLAVAPMCRMARREFGFVERSFERLPWRALLTRSRTSLSPMRAARSA